MRNSIRKINESFFSQGILITSYQIKPLKLVGAYFIGIHYIAYIYTRIGVYTIWTYASLLKVVPTRLMLTTRRIPSIDVI